MKMEVQDLPDGATRVVLEGDLDAAGANSIGERFREIAGSRPKLIIDMGRVEHVGDSGAHLLIQAAKANEGGGGKLILLAPAPAVWDVIVTCGAETILPAAYDLDAALAAVS